MADFNYEAIVSFDSDKGSRGERVTATIQFDHPSDTVKRAMARIPEYGIFETLKPGANDTFSWSYVIPYEAPVGAYTIEFFGFNQAGARGPIRTAVFTITA